MKHPTSARFGESGLLTLASSHLGSSTNLHGEVGRYIRFSMLEARRQKQVLLVAAETAIEPWAVRAAELFSVPVIRVHVVSQESIDSGEASASSIDFGTSASEQFEIVIQTDGSISRDEVVIAIADKVDVVFVRPKGAIEKSLNQRLGRGWVPSVRVAFHSGSIGMKCGKAVEQLMRRGAVGWYAPRVVEQQTPRPSASYHYRIVDDQWAKSSGEWLVHCTRAANGPWPGQSQIQYRDSHLLAENHRHQCCGRTPIETLRRIIRMQRLIASALTSRHAWPVVCFSAVPLAEILQRRCYRPHLRRWDYEPYGVAIRKRAAIEHGCQAVVYGNDSDQQKIDPSQRYLYQARGTTYDWTKEDEWRFLGDVDLGLFRSDDIRIFVPDESDIPELTDRFPISVVQTVSDAKRVVV